MSNYQEQKRKAKERNRELKEESGKATKSPDDFNKAMLLAGSEREVYLRRNARRGFLGKYKDGSSEDEKGKKERFDHFSMFGDPKNMLEIGAYTNAIKTYLNLLGIADVTEEDALKYAVGRFILETDDRVPDGVELRMRVKSLLQEKKQEQNEKADILNELENSGRSGSKEVAETSGRIYSRTDQELIRQRDYLQGRKDGEVTKNKEREWDWFKSTIDRDIQLLGEGTEVSSLLGERPSINYQEKLKQTEKYISKLNNENLKKVEAREKEPIKVIQERNLDTEQIKREEPKTVVAEEKPIIQEINQIFIRCTWNGKQEEKTEFKVGDDIRLSEEGEKKKRRFYKD